jgi:hypothetical protein
MFESEAVREVQALKPRWRNALAQIAESAPNYTDGLFGWAGGGIPANPWGWSKRDARALVRRGLAEEDLRPGWVEGPREVLAYPAWRPTERGKLLAAGMIPAGRRERVEERRGSSS